jgi:hypothetical protein
VRADQLRPEAELPQNKDASESDGCADQRRVRGDLVPPAPVGRSGLFLDNLLSLAQGAEVEDAPTGEAGAEPKSGLEEPDADAAAGNNSRRHQGFTSDETSTANAMAVITKPIQPA